MLIFYNFCCCSAVKSCPTFCDPVDCSTPGSSLLHYLLGVHSNSCSSRWWCHPAISSSVIPFSCLQAFLSSGSFPVSESSLSIMWPKYCSFTSILFFHWIFKIDLRWTGWISLLSKGLSRVFPSTTVQKHQFFGTQLSLWSSSHIHTALLEKPHLWLYRLCWQSDVSAFWYTV